MDEVLLDTDILSEVLKSADRRVAMAARRYLQKQQRLTFSAMTAYEIVRGMRLAGARRQLASFQSLMNTSDVVPVSLSVLLRAADLWVEGRRQGRPHNDADLIIAASALETNRVLVTGNLSHYSWISGLVLDNWRQPSR